MHFRFTTAGESHGRGLVAVIEGVPAGLSLVAARDIDPELKRRQGGYGRGARMKIEQDRAELISGVRFGETLGSPVSLVIWNRDWENWQLPMSHEPPPDATDKQLRRVYLPRPGHADLVGVLKYARKDARDILERASARETTARVAAGAIAKRLLAEFGITIGSHVVQLGGVAARVPDELPEDLNAAVDDSPVRTLDKDAEARMIEAIDAARRAGDTLGGIFEVVARGVPVGLGSHVSWDRRLDGRLAQALMSIQAMKGVEIGLGFEAARRRGSQVHDEIETAAPGGNPARTGGYQRRSNNAGGLEGGITTGAPIVVRVAMKPLSSLMQPLASVDLRTGEPAAAVRERSDVVALPAAGVVGEAMVAIVLADAMLEKFGADSLAEMRRNFDSYLEQIERHREELRAISAREGAAGPRAGESA
ncbi:MAG TPA: chorismate synthase [Longimicrobiales bacterium]|nr:chorismate synthase [Longimicrobiales bacterium]